KIPSRRNWFLHENNIADFACSVIILCEILSLYYARLSKRGVEILEAADADALHPLEVELDAFLGYVTVHPMPPNTRFGRVRRVSEASGKRVGFLVLRGGSERQRQNDGNRHQAGRFSRSAKLGQHRRCLLVVTMLR